jgi:hypothetical protein
LGPQEANPVGLQEPFALIDYVDVVERILKHLKVWDPQPDSLTPAGPDPPYRKARPYP